MRKDHWLLYAVITVLAWGLWGALIDTPARAGFPETLGYIVWSLTMIPPCLVAMGGAPISNPYGRRATAFPVSVGAESAL